MQNRRRARIENANTRAIREAVERLGYECVHVGLKTDGKPRIQVLVDSLGGVNVDDCEKVSRSVSRLLDELDPGPDGAKIPAGSYDLEVSSPGVERPLFTPEDYARFIGREARVRLKDPQAGRKTLTGFIRAVEEDHVELEPSGGDFAPERVNFENIKAGNLVFRGFEPKPKPGKRGKDPHHYEEELY